MNFMLRNGWHISFLEADCRTALPRKLAFADCSKICTMAERYGSRILEDYQGLEQGIETGRCEVWLSLTEEEIG